MSRAVYVGGFANGRSLAKGVRQGLGRYYEDVDIFTFSNAMKHPDRVLKAVKSVDVFTHSAGLLALVGAQPEFIHAFNAPLPTPRTKLLGRTLVKTAHMHQPGRGIQEARDVAAVTKFSSSATAELIAHPVANLRPFFNESISRLDAIGTAAAANKQGIGARLITTENDDYFHYDASEIQRAANVGLIVTILPGEHDELLLRPIPTIANYLDHPNAPAGPDGMSFHKI